MNRDHEDQALLQHVKNVLNASAETLDDATRSRLRDARARALDAVLARELAPARSPSTSYPTRRVWLWPVGGMALACATLLSWMLWFHPMATQAPGLGLEQLEFLSSAEGLEFYTDLDFYQWLAGDADAG